MITALPRVATTPEMAAATELFMGVLAERYFEDLMRWISAREDEPKEWQEATIFGDSLLYLTAEELSALKSEFRALMDRYFERVENRALRPAGARPITFLAFAFPQQGPRREGG